MPSYQDYGRMLGDFANAYDAAHPGAPQEPYFDPAAEVSGAGQGPQYTADRAAYGKYAMDRGNAWLDSLSPSQQQEWQTLQDARINQLQHKSNMGALYALSAPLLAAGAGSLLGASGAAGTGAGIGAEAGLGAGAGATNLFDIVGPYLSSGAASFPVYSPALPAFADIPGAVGAAGGAGGGFDLWGAGADLNAPYIQPSTSLFDIVNLNQPYQSPITQLDPVTVHGKAEPYSLGTESVAGPGLTTGDFTRMDRANGYGSTNPIFDFIQNSFNQSSFPRTAANLFDMYNNYKNKKRNQGMVDNLTSLYGPNSPYAQQLNKALARAYAASGRRSDVGGRNVELQARLAEMNSRLAPTLNMINNQQGMYNNRFLGNLWDLGQSTGVFKQLPSVWDKLPSLAGLFGG